MLQFDYRVIQLNRLSWRDFLKQPNPAAAALMSRMRIAPEDRVNVQIECLRLLITLKLDPARSELIWSFVEAYLQLNAEETKQYVREVASFTPQEQETAMEMITSWRSKGREEGRQEGRQVGKEEGRQVGKEEGRQEGKEELIACQIRHRFGVVSSEVSARLNHLSSKQLNALGEALLDFNTLTDLEVWLSRYTQQ